MLGEHLSNSLAAFKHVDGVDFSARYIQHGVQLQNNENVRYTVKNEGEIVEFKEVSLDKLSLAPNSNRWHYSFQPR